MLILFFSLLSGSAQGFYLERTTNRNRVVYDEELRAHWEMRETDGHVEELTPYERDHLYGVGREGDEFFLRAMPRLRLRLERGEVLFQGKAVVHFFVRLRGLIPSVEAIEVYFADGEKRILE